MVVALCRCGLRIFGWHGVRAWWHDYSRLGVPRGNLGVNIVAVVRPVAGEGRHWPLDLLKQGADLRAVVSILVGQHRRDDPARVGVRGEMQLAPATAPLAAMLLDQPLARPAKLQPRAVHQVLSELVPTTGLAGRGGAGSLQG